MNKLREPFLQRKAQLFGLEAGLQNEAERGQVLWQLSQPVNPLPENWHCLDLQWDKRLPAIVKRVETWYKAQAGGLILSGSFGCGKSHLATGVDIFGGESARMIGEPDLLAAIRATYNERNGNEAGIIKEYSRAKILIIDDLGTAKAAAEWYQDILWRLLEPRTNGNLPTLITTNLNLKDLNNRVGGRVIDRLAQLLGSQDNFLDMTGIKSYRWRGWQRPA